MSDTIVVPAETVEIVDSSEYCMDVTDHFSFMPKVAEPLLCGAKTALSKIEQMLYSAPAFVNAVKALVPEETIQAVLTDEQKNSLPMVR